MLLAGRHRRPFACAVLLVCAAARAEVEHDDATARLRATREWYGHSLEGRARLLEEAARERDRYGIRSARSTAAVQAASAVAPGGFVSLGPTRNDFSFNGERSDGNVDSGRVRQILPHPTDPDVLYLATSGGGVWKTWNATASTVQWEPLTDALGTLSIGTLAMDPANPDILFLGFGDPFDVRQPGIVRSLDGGGTWSTPATLTAHYQIGGAAWTVSAGTVTDIKVDPLDSRVVLVATDAGLFRSTDGGGTWAHVPVASPSAQFFWMWSLAWVGNGTWILSGQAAEISAATSPVNGGALALWRSTDDGATWTYAVPALPGGENTALLAGRVTIAVAPSTLLQPSSARVYLLAADRAGGSQLDLYRSDDAGLGFHSLQVNANTRPQNPNWNQVSMDVLASQAWYNQALLVDPDDPDTVFIGGQLSMVRSQDGGRAWEIVSNWLPHNTQNFDIQLAYVHADVHAFAVGAAGSLYAGSDGGLFVSSNARTDPASAVSFDSSRNQGVVTHLAYTVACAPESWPAELQGFVAGGTQDNGTRVRDGVTTTYNQLVGGDGVGLSVSGGTHRDATSGAMVPDVFLASAACCSTAGGGEIERSTDGRTFDSFMSGLTGALPFFVQIARDAAAAPAEVFLTFSASPPSFYRWLTTQPGWERVLGTLHWQNPSRVTAAWLTSDGTLIGLRNLATHAAAADVWGVVSNRYAYVTTNSGADWAVSLQPNPTGAQGGAWKLSSIQLDRRDASGRTYWVTSLADTVIDDGNTEYPIPAGFGHLYQTTDGGLNWAAVGARGAARLPDVGADVIRQDPSNPATLYAGTELGLYRSTDDGATWARFGAGSLPLVEVRDICVAPLGRRLTVATYGRGFWQIDTGASASPAGVHGLGDTNFDGRIDGEDLIDLADAFGTFQASPAYRWEADLTGSTSQVDQADLDALLAKFGGQP